MKVESYKTYLGGIADFEETGTPIEDWKTSVSASDAMWWPAG